jgi:hypothetical protein
MYPGTQITDQVPEPFEVQSLLMSAERHLLDAALALSWFEETLEDDVAKMRRGWDVDREYRKLATSMLEKDADTHDPAFVWKVQRLAYALSLNAGVLPLTYLQAVPFVHARTFLFALDGISRALGTTSRVRNAPDALSDIKRHWVETFPGLRDVRDSAHHGEDRVRGRGRDGKPIDLKPLVNEAIDAPGGVLATNMLIGRNYGSTVSDGTYKEVEISEASLRACESYVQEAVDAFSWKGFSRLGP